MSVENECVGEVPLEYERDTAIEEVSLGDWEEVIENYNRQVSREAMEEISASDPVAQECDYRRFISESNGRNRRRRKPRLVELLEYHGKIYTLKGDNAYGKIDEIAADVLRDVVEEDKAVQVFLARLRGLSKWK